MVLAKGTPELAETNEKKMNEEIEAPDPFNFEGKQVLFKLFNTMLDG